MKKNKKYDTLVLNRSYIPVSVAHNHKAMSLLYSDSAHSLDENFASYNWNDWLQFSILPTTLDNGYNFINTIDHKIAIPDTIVLRHFDSLPKRDVKYSRQTVFQRDGFMCLYCGKIFKSNELTIDHIIPKSKGGKSTWDNTCACCSSCNRKKANKSLKESGMHLVKMPTEPRWISPMNRIASLSDIRPAWKHFLKMINH